MYVLGTSCFSSWREVTTSIPLCHWSPWVEGTCKVSLKHKNNNNTASKNTNNNNNNNTESKNTNNNNNNTKRNKNHVCQVEEREQYRFCLATSSASSCVVSFSNVFIKIVF